MPFTPVNTSARPLVVERHGDLTLAVASAGEQLFWCGRRPWSRCTRQVTFAVRQDGDPDPHVLLCWFCAEQCGWLRQPIQQPAVAVTL